MQDIILIAAMAENRVIGRNNAMPWSIRGNLAHFKEMTMGWPCIMGRKTWESLPKKPLPGRLNIIISKTMQDLPGWPDGIVTDSTNILIETQQKKSFSNTKVCKSLQESIEYCSDYEKIFICGGESIYNQAMPFANKIDLTLIRGQYEGDTFFPELDDSWVKTGTVNFDDFSIITYNKK